MKDYYEEINSITEDIVEMFTAKGFDVNVKNHLYHQKCMQVNFYYYHYKAFITFKTTKLDKLITTENVIKEKNWFVTIITDEEEIISEKYNLNKLINLILSEKVYRKIVKNESVVNSKKNKVVKPNTIKTRTKTTKAAPVRRPLSQELRDKNIYIQKHLNGELKYVYNKRTTEKNILKRFPLTEEGLQQAIKFSENPVEYKTRTGVKYLQLWSNNKGNTYYKFSKKGFSCKLFPYSEEGLQQAINYINSLENNP